MRLSHQFEQFILSRGVTTVKEITRFFGVSRRRCMEELREIIAYGVAVTEEGIVFVADKPKSNVA